MPRQNQYQEPAGANVFQGEPAIVLHAEDGTDATVLPGIGANCISFRVPVEARGMVEALVGPASPQALHDAPNTAGVPILWPHPGQHRLPLPWEGERVTPGAFADGRAKLAGHGFASGVPWKVIAATSNTLTCRMDARLVADASESWPWPAVLTVIHRVEPGALVLELEVENVADGEAPLMAGLHPYFPLSFLDAARTGARETCALWTDGDQLWEVTGGAATGRVCDLDTVTSNDVPLDLRQPRTVAEMDAHAAARGERLALQLYARREALVAASHRGPQDVPASSRQRPNAAPDAPGGVTSGLIDRASGITLTLETGQGFGTVGVYCPVGRPFVSLEPRSALPDAMTLTTEYPELTTGLRSLAPGERWRSWARTSLSCGN